MTAAEFMREYQVETALMVLAIIMFLSLRLKHAKRNRERKREERAAKHISPDDLPDLSGLPARVKIITVLAAGGIIGFTVVAVFNSL